MRKQLMPLEEALAKIISRANLVTDQQMVPLLEALGRVLAEDQCSTVDVPPCDNSAMDGYALCFADLAASDYLLPISQRVAAGEVGRPLEEGTTARIFTGAPVPEGADTVVMQEDTKQVSESVRISREVALGDNVRPRGQDIAKDSVVLKKWQTLKPQDIGLLASIGITHVPVLRRLKVAVLSTGDELVEPGKPLGPGQIYNSNRYTLSAVLMALGCEVIDGGIVADDFQQTCDQLEYAASQADLIISSGGVSVGEEDHVKAAVESLGELMLWKLNIKPGKPLAFGRVKDTPFFGLPGNPSSVFATFCLTVRPYIKACQGQREVSSLLVEVVADFDRSGSERRQEYLRARVEEEVGVLKARLYANQSSGVLASVSWANALLVMPPKQAVVKGDKVKALLMSELLT